MFKIYLIVAFMGAIAGGYSYHQVTVSKFEAGIAKLEANNRTLKENKVQLELAKATAEKSLKVAEEQAKAQGEAMTKLTQANNALQRDKDQAMRIFKDHNLTRLARARPDSIQRLSNAKTKKVFKELEDDTKEIMALDDTPPTDGVQPNAETGVRTKGTNNPTGTTDSNGS